MEFTDGDMKVLPKLVEFSEQQEGWDAQSQARWESIGGYLKKAL
jgi:hypothetical protein